MCVEERDRQHSPDNEALSISPAAQHGRKMAFGLVHRGHVSTCPFCRACAGFHRNVQGHVVSALKIPTGRFECLDGTLTG